MSDFRKFKSENRIFISPPKSLYFITIRVWVILLLRQSRMEEVGLAFDGIMSRTKVGVSRGFQRAQHASRKTGFLQGFGSFQIG